MKNAILWHFLKTFFLLLLLFQFSGHWKEAHGDEVLPFKCDECDVRKHSKATLISHKKKWHKPRKMQKCDMCDFQVKDTGWSLSEVAFSNGCGSIVRLKKVLLTP